MRDDAGGPLLLCYDGSDGAANAIASASSLFPGRPAIVLAAWEPFLPVFTGYPGWPVTSDEPMRANAERLAAEGCERARTAGIAAKPMVVKADAGVGRAILAAADEAGASIIVMGSRGLTGLRSLLLGSISHEVLQRAHRPVAIVPSVPLAAARAGALRHGG